MEIKETVVSFLQNLLFSQTQKEGVRGGPKSLRHWRNLPDRQHRYDLRHALRRPLAHALPVASNNRLSARRRQLRSNGEHWMIAIGGRIIVHVIIKAIEGGVSYTYMK